MSRAHYVKEWALLMSTSLKMAVIRAFRRESAEKFRFWADLYRSLAMGNLELARDYPFARFESSIESAAATAGPRAPVPAPAHAEAASC
jgi:hypothetical protein